MRRSEKIIIITIIVLIIFSVGTAIVIRTIDEFKSGGSDLSAFLVVVFARLSTLIGFLAIMVALFLRGHFRDVERPKIDLLEMEERIEKASKENLKKSD